MTRKMLTPKKLAERCDVHPNTVARWRMRGVGPKYKREGDRIIRYPLEEVEKWESETQTGTHQN